MEICYLPDARSTGSAAAAYSVGETTPAAGIVGAIHRSKRPTLAFPLTALFPVLRRGVGSDETAAEDDLVATFSIQRSWLNGVWTPASSFQS